MKGLCNLATTALIGTTACCARILSGVEKPRGQRVFTGQSPHSGHGFASLFVLSSVYFITDAL